MGGQEFNDGSKMTMHGNGLDEDWQTVLEMCSQKNSYVPDVMCSQAPHNKFLNNQSFGSCHLAKLHVPDVMCCQAPHNKFVNNSLLDFRHLTVVSCRTHARVHCHDFTFGQSPFAMQLHRGNRLSVDNTGSSLFLN